MGIRIGDLVLPRDEREFLFATANEIKFEAEPMEIFWDDMPGVVIDIVLEDERLDYSQIKVMVGEVIGWTYSDYVKVIRKSK